jgi:Carboxypeptidase regulatory-like domain
VLARPTETTAAVPEQSTETAPRDSGIRGQVLWADGRPTARVQLFLKGVPNSPNANEQWVMRTDDGGRFEFKRIPPGTYMLTNKVAGSPTWRLRVKLAPGEITSLDLGEDNSAKVRDDFPGA